MKLITEKGEVHLPEGFSFEVEQNSAFFSENGAASLAATIPATPDDLDKLGNPTRIARNTRYVNLLPAIVSCGVFQKKGQLIVESASNDGISCAVALEDSDFYSQFKEKGVKEIFAAKVLHDFSTPEDWYNQIFLYYSETNYQGPHSNPTLLMDMAIIPVAVNYDPENDSYQVNNEPLESTGDGMWPLAHSARLLPGGDSEINVPEGYGIAPFLKLRKFLSELFELCGYTVRNNAFETNPALRNLILLHQCSDVICNGWIDYSDLVPSVTVEDILSWLLDKFHAQIVVYPESKTVDIVLLEDILTAGYDADLSRKLIGKLAFTYEKTSRVLLQCDTSIDGAAPAAETLEDLKAKYGSVKELDANGWRTYTGSGLVLRLATGRYYEIHQSMNTLRMPQGSQGTVTTSTSRRDAAAGSSSGSARRTNNVHNWVDVGSNYFDYDRKNSEETEEHSPEDLIPPMVFVNGVLMPYIGERKHRNTAYNDSEKDEDQDIIIVEYAGISAVCDPIEAHNVNGTYYIQTDIFGSHYKYGTTQKYDNAGVLRNNGHSLTAPEMYQRFWQRYNKILLNNRITLEGQFNLTIEELLQWQMYSLKLFSGQLLLPQCLTYTVGHVTRCEEAKFLLVKDFEDGTDDVPTTLPEPAYKWQENLTEVEAVKDAYAEQSGQTIYAAFNDAYSSGSKDLFLLAPTAAGQTSAIIRRTVDLFYYGGSPRNPQTIVVGTEDVDVWYDSVPV